MSRTSPLAFLRLFDHVIDSSVSLLTEPVTGDRGQLLLDPTSPRPWMSKTHAADGKDDVVDDHRDHDVLGLGVDGVRNTIIDDINDTDDTDDTDDSDDTNVNSEDEDVAATLTLAVPRRSSALDMFKLAEAEVVPEPCHCHREYKSAWLTTYDRASHWLRDHPHIHAGYRPIMSTWETTLTLFRMHNETLNTWTHLLSLAGTLMIASWTLTETLAEQTWQHHVVFGTYFFGAVTVFTGSTLYHGWCNMSAHANHCLLQLDLGGIGLVITGGYFGPIYYGFSCHPTQQTLYLSIASVMMAFAGMPLLVPKLQSRQFRAIRTLFYFCLVIFIVFPLTHMYWLVGQAHLAPAMQSVRTMAAIGVTGTVLYATQFPERIWPGRFDLIGASHQLWHVCVTGAIFSHYITIHRLFEWSKSHPQLCEMIP